MHDAAAFVRDQTGLLGLLTEVACEEEGLRGRSPFPEMQAVVGLSLHAEQVVAACELVEASFSLVQLEQLFLEQVIPSEHREHNMHQWKSTV